jgi:hypothetical protein
MSTTRFCALIEIGLTMNGSCKKSWHAEHVSHLLSFFREISPRYFINFSITTLYCIFFLLNTLFDEHAELSSLPEGDSSKICFLSSVAPAANVGENCWPSFMNHRKGYCRKGVDHPSSAQRDYWQTHQWRYMDVKNLQRPVLEFCNSPNSVSRFLLFLLLFA